MKKLIKATLLGAALCAVNAQANWTVIYPNAATVNSGESGTSTFLYTPDINGTISSGYTLNVFETSPSGGFWSGVGGDGNPITDFNIISEPSSFVAGQQFAVVVSWTISSTPVTDPTQFFINFGLPTSNGTQTSSQNFYLNPTSVPEPGQVLAGSMLLGGGVLLVGGRRWFKNAKA